MVENPSVEIARPLRTDVSGAQFRGLVNLALAEGLRSAIARPTSLRAFLRELAPLSIALIVQGQHRHPQRTGHSRLDHAASSRGWLFRAVLPAWRTFHLRTSYPASPARDMSRKCGVCNERPPG